MPRIYGRELKKNIADYLKNTTTGINAELLKLDTKYNETLASKILIKDQNILIDEENDASLSIAITYTEKNRQAGNLNETPTNMTEIYKVNIDFFYKGNDKQSEFNKILDNYEEAMTNCIHNSNIPGTTLVYLDNAQRDFIESPEKRVIFGGLRFQITCRIN